MPDKRQKVDDPLAVGTKILHYQVLGEIDRGDGGRIYRGRDTRLDREVAIRVLSRVLAEDPGQRERFERDARKVAQISHPHVLPIFDVGIHEGQPFLVTELLEGTTLAELVASGPLPLSRAAEIAIQIARGLSAAHEQTVVHGDLSPSRIFVSRAGLVKVLGFGLRSSVASDSGDSQAPANSTRPGYAPPERARGETADQRGDIFALGAMFYEMLSGQPPFGGGDPSEIVDRVLSAEPRPLTEVAPGVPVAIERVVRRCLSKRPYDRFSTASGVAFALDALSSSDVSRIEVEVPHSRRRLRRWLLVPAALAALVMGLATSRGTSTTGVTSPLLSFKRISVGGARMGTGQFAPDGATLVFDARIAGREQAFTIRPDETAIAHPLGIEGAVYDISSDGMLLLMSEWDGSRGDLLQVPTGGGTPRALLDQIRSADWAGDGTLAIVRGDDEKPFASRLELPPGKVIYRATRSPNDDPLFGSSLTSVNVSDDGALIKISLAARFLFLDRDGREVARLEHDRQAESGDWIPGGAEYWYTRHTRSMTTLEAVDMTGAVRQIASFPGKLRLHDLSVGGRAAMSRDQSSNFLRTWSRDGGREIEIPLEGAIIQDMSEDGDLVVFTTPDSLRLLRSADSSLVELAKAESFPGQEVWGGTISPDQQRVAAIAKTGATTRSLVLLSMGAGDRETLELPLGSGIAGSFDPPTWFPGGDRLLFLFFQQQSPYRHCYVYELDTRQYRAVAPGGWGCPYGVKPVSPDGRRFLAQRASEDIWSLFEVDGSRPPIELPGLGRSNRPVRWSPDGRSLYVWRPLPDEERGVFLLYDVATGAITEFLELDLPRGLEELDYLRIWPRISADGTSYAYTYYREERELYAVEGFDFD